MWQKTAYFRLVFARQLLSKNALKRLGYSRYKGLGWGVGIRGEEEGIRE